MVKTLRVTNISPVATVKQLEELFSYIGPTSPIQILDDPVYARGAPSIATSHASSLTHFTDHRQSVRDMPS